MQQLIWLTIFILSAHSVHTVPVGVSIGLPERYHPIESLYHAQDNYGQYVYGYTTPTISKSETKTADGVTKGGYSYIDSDGHLQTVEYTADALHGFRVAASNLPADLPDVAHAKAQHIADYEAIKNERARIAELHTVGYSNPIAVPISAVPRVPIHLQVPEPVTDLPEVVKARNAHLAILHAAYNAPVVAPQPVQDLPEVVKARNEHLRAFEQTKLQHAALKAEISLSPVPDHIVNGVVPVKTVSESYQQAALPVAYEESVAYTPVNLGPYAAEIRADDKHGQYSYGYVGPHSAHSESRTSDGVTRGGYSYIDAHGIIQTVHYIADSVHGFRVAASNIPVDLNHARGHSIHPVPAISDKVNTPAVPNEQYKHEILY